MLGATVVQPRSSVNDARSPRYPRPPRTRPRPTRPPRTRPPPRVRPHASAAPGPHLLEIRDIRRLGRAGCRARSHQASAQPPFARPVGQSTADPATGRSSGIPSHAPSTSVARTRRRPTSPRGRGPRHRDTWQVIAGGDAWTMAGKESLATIGARRSRVLRLHVAETLTNARAAGGISVREVARKVGVSADRIARAEKAEPSTLTIDLVARIAPVVGLQLAASLYPSGDPTRDRAHLALLERFRRRLSALLSWRTEVPMPITGDLRSADAVIGGDPWTILVEAETRLTDVQASERKLALKARDLGADRRILLIADTRRNRDVVRLHPELRQRYPIGTRACLSALGRGKDPGGDCLVTL